MSSSKKNGKVVKLPTKGTSSLLPQATDQNPVGAIPSKKAPVGVDAQTTGVEEVPDNAMG